LHYLAFILRSATLAALVSCTSVPQRPVITTPGAVGGGTILSLRMINSPADRDTWTTALLADAGGRLRGGEPLVEFIVRADDGATLSIVQANDQGFRTGDRVVIVRDAQTRLARPT